MKVIDCTIFNNEIDMLKFRLEALSEDVDFFIICESRKTFTNKDKPLFFSDYLKSKQCSLSNNIVSKIILLQIDEFNNLNTNWERERYQREYSCNYIINNNLFNPEDIILSMDLDEIPSVDFIRSLQNIKNIEFTPLTMWLSYFYPNYVKIYGHDAEWSGPFAVKRKFLYINSFTDFRRKARTFPKKLISKNFRFSGWHLSYQGDENFYKQKLLSFSHQEKKIQNNYDISIESVTNKRISPFDNINNLPEWAFINIKEMGFPEKLLNHSILKNYSEESDSLKDLLVLYSDKYSSIKNPMLLNIKKFVSYLLNKNKIE